MLKKILIITLSIVAPLAMAVYDYKEAQTFSELTRRVEKDVRQVLLSPEHAGDQTSLDWEALQLSMQSSDQDTRKKVALDLTEILNAALSVGRQLTGLLPYPSWWGSHVDWRVKEDTYQKQANDYTERLNTQKIQFEALQKELAGWTAQQETCEGLCTLFDPDSVVAEKLQILFDPGPYSLSSLTLQAVKEQVDAPLASTRDQKMLERNQSGAIAMQTQRVLLSMVQQSLGTSIIEQVNRVMRANLESSRKRIQKKIQELQSNIDQLTQEMQDSQTYRDQFAMGKLSECFKKRNNFGDLTILGDPYYLLVEGHLLGLLTDAQKAPDQAPAFLALYEAGQRFLQALHDMQRTEDAPAEADES